MSSARVQQLRAVLQWARHEISELSKASKRAEYTDLDAVWDVLYRIRAECNRQLRRKEER